MAKQLIFAVAGSGKTTKILDAIDDNQRSLIITYTHENRRSLEAGIVHKFGHLPKHVTVVTYFSFLYRFCVRPYFSYELRDRSFTWKAPPRFPSWRKNDDRHYMNGAGYIYANRAAKLISEFDAVNDINARLARHFDCFFVDEVQDFAANDFNLLLALTDADLEIMLVGDFFQHTFDTSRDGQVKKNLHKKGVEAYLNEFRRVNIDIDTKSLDKTYRCSPSVCDFITNVVGIPIISHRTEDSTVQFVDDAETALNLARAPGNVTLFLRNYRKFDCHANNWGRSKGLNSYQDVCVALNPGTFKHVSRGTVDQLPNETRNKLYVACSRARGDLYLFEEKFLTSLRYSSSV
ncbi:AAA family ATPase [Parasphingorhabdus flavimaris]|uniref:AAA family ATPase n=1 Tax=Parasphingorhabdus flavimaris TaxID=266812 RepID=A0ABX2N4K5_9SPHN|nr:AAA family ATPase [Parasphingorhabdus flavimaris]NVD28599.1 AAA family ATPase [Parasphingorhabdus flavimaris]